MDTTNKQPPSAAKAQQQQQQQHHKLHPEQQQQQKKLRTPDTSSTLLPSQQQPITVQREQLLLPTAQPLPQQQQQQQQQPSKPLQLHLQPEQQEPLSAIQEKSTEHVHICPAPAPAAPGRVETPGPKTGPKDRDQPAVGPPVSFSFYKTINTVIKSSRKIIVRVCEVTNVKTKLKMFNLYSTMNKRNGADDKEAKEVETTGHDRFCQERPSRSSYRRKKRKMRRAQSAAEFQEPRTEPPLTAASKRMLFRGRSISSEHDNNSETEHSERSPLVSAKLDSLAKFLFSRSLLQEGTSAAKENDSPTRHSVRYQQYTALDSGIGAPDRSPRERAARERAYAACQEWLQNTGGRYESIAHLDDIGSRSNKHWFLLNDCTIRTDRLMTLLPLPPDCIALEELPPSECPQGVLMELLGSLQHPYIYPVLDLGFFPSDSHQYTSLVMPFNPRGSLKDLIYKSQWNEPWSRKYTRKSTCLPLSQVQRLGRQILEALLFLRERGIPSHGHLHSGNVILQNGVARLSGLENGLLGLNSRVNAVIWARSAPDIDNIDVICFGHLLFEMCAGYELTSPQPTPGHYQLDLERYPQVVDVLQMIFESPDGRYPTVEELVLCDIFRNIDLREMRGTCVPSFKHGLSSSTLSLLNAVRRRQGAILSGSYSEGSSPCTPPSTPRDRKTGDVESSDLSSSDSEDLLDEIVIASARIDDPCHYDPLSSPIHYCDNNVHSDDNSNSNNHNNNTIIRIDSIEEAHGSGTPSSSGAAAASVAGGSGGPAAGAPVCLNPSSAYKNSKSRRMEYSRRGMMLGLSNPSQDSAFGSMTDGESSRASSFKLSSFASMNSPIDEGVEDLLAEQIGLPAAGTATGTDNLATTIANMKYIDSTGSSPCHDYHHHQQQHQSQMLPQTSGYGSVVCAVSSSRTEPSIASRDISPSPGPRFLEPPKLMINNHSSTTTNSSLCYTLSPLRKCATTEVFSQKYRVSSFEDMSYNSIARKSIKNTSRKIFRSFEEERRIDSAFMPIDTTRPPAPPSGGKLQQQLSLPPMLTPSPKHVPSPVSPSRKYHTAQSYQNLHTIVPTARERGLQWRSNLIKSNECLFETSFNSVSPAAQHHHHQQHHQFRSVSSFSGSHHLRSHGSQDLPTTASGSEMSCDRFILTPEPLPPGSPSRTPSVTSTAISSPSASLASTSRMRPNRTDRQQLFSLARFKHSTILDSVSIEDFSSEMSLRGAASTVSRRSNSPASPSSRSAASGASTSSTGDGATTLEYEAKPLTSDLTCTSDASDTTSEDATSVSTTDTSLLKSPVPQRTTPAEPPLSGEPHYIVRHKHAARDVRQYLDDGAGGPAGDEYGASGSEEKTPLLDGMELSPISPTESEQML
uniref:Protein kinase domain-containing protein n=1 Tax=Anopheles quadriannulatus TaxID=34691 RepID=A0A904A5S8_ANOQN